MTASGPRYFAHETAVIEEGAVIGGGTRVWLHVQIRPGAVVGADCNIGKDVYLAEGVTVGDRCKLLNGAFLCTGVTVEDEVFVGAGTAFTNDRRPRATSTDWVLEETVVRRGASIGANSTIMCGTELGSFCMIGAGSVVTRSVEDHELVVGNPARRLGWVCSCGQVVARTAERPDDLRCPDCRDTAASA